mmetsp:Transcript_11159/g.41700  ORF Transcript_11159/g.41700 Transcript_11159/m.41700 type:complete len:100 (+) Transcript_11159:5357-5656(+)
MSVWSNVVSSCCVVTSVSNSALITTEAIVTLLATTKSHHSANNVEGSFLSSVTREDMNNVLFLAKKRLTDVATNALEYVARAHLAGNVKKSVPTNAQLF